MSTIFTAFLLAAAMVTPSDGIVRGMVTDPDGSPVEGADIYIIATSSTDESVAQGVTEKDGRFAIAMPPSPGEELQFFDRRLSIVAVKEGCGIASKSELEATATRRAVNIQLARAKSVTFEILDPQTAPLSDAKVTFGWSDGYFYALRGHEPSKLTSKTDKNGRCVINVVPESAKSLGFNIKSERYGTQRARVELGSDNRVQVSLRPVGSITGQLIAEDERAIADLQLEILSQPARKQSVYSARARARTNHEGRFEVPVLAAGIVSVHVELRKELPWRIFERVATQLKEGEDKQLLIKLKRGVRFASSIIDGKSSAPIPDLRIAVRNSDTHEVYQLKTDDGGRFEVYVTPGTIHISPEDLPRPFFGLITSQEGVKIESGTTEFTPEPFALTPRATIRGTVVDEEDHPVADAWATANWNQEMSGGWTSSQSCSVRCDNDGRFEFGPVPGDLIIRFRAESQLAASTETVSVRGRDANDVTLAISPAGSVVVSGQVVDEKSRPLTNAHVVLQRHSGRSVFNGPRNVWSRDLDSEWTLSTDKDGRFAFSNPLPRLKRYQLSVEMAGRATYTNRDLSLENAGASLELPTIELGLIRRLEGVVVDNRGQPVAAAKVVAKGVGQRATLASVFTDQQGHFDLKNVHPDARFIFAEADEDYLFRGIYITGNEGPITIPLTHRRDDVAVTPADPDEYLVPAPHRQKLLKGLLLPLLARGREFESQSVQRRVLEYLTADEPELVLAEMESIASPNFRFKLLIDLGLVDEAVELVEQMDSPYSRSYSYVTAAQAVGSPERKLQYLARALTNGREVPTPENRVISVANVAEQLEQMGQRDTARKLFEEFLPMVGQLSSEGRNPFAKGYFATRLAVFEPEKALALIPDMIERRLSRHAGNIAHTLADRNPEMAERALDMIPEDYQKRRYAARVGYRMATVDPDRAVKIANLDRDYALSVVAYALREINPDKSRELMRLATSGSGFRVSHGAKLPYVAAVDPAIFSEVLWRSIAYETLGTNSASDNTLMADARAAILLKLYGDPQVADEFGKTFLDRVYQLPPAYSDRSSNTVNASVVAAMTLLDPERTVEWHNEHVPNATEENLRLSYPEPPYDVIASLLSKPRQEIEKYLQSALFRAWVIDRFDH